MAGGHKKNIDRIRALVKKQEKFYINTLSMIVWVNIQLNRTVVDSH